MQKNQTKTIALDIDDMLTTMEVRTLREQGPLDPVHHRPEAFLTVKFMHDDREYEIENLLVPGCLEFLLSPMYQHPNGGVKNYDRMDMPRIDPKDWSSHFKNANTLFYAAGVLQHAMDRHRGEGLSLPEAVWQAQGELWIDREARDERFPLQFFAEGRDVLRQYNPDLNFAVSAAED